MVGLDWGVDIQEARKTIAGRVATQGNLDPCVLFAEEQQIRAHVKKMLEKSGTLGHIANLGHGLMPDHDPEHVGYFIRAVQEISQTMDH